MRPPDARFEVDPRLDPIKPFMWHTSTGLFHATTRLTLPELDAMHNLIDLPSKPYELVVHIPKDYSRLGIPQVRGELASGQRGLTLVEGLHLAQSLRHLIPVDSIDLLETETVRSGTRRTVAISFRENGLLDIGIQNAVRNDYIRAPFIFAVSCNKFNL